MATRQIFRCLSLLNLCCPHSCLLLHLSISPPLHLPISLSLSLSLSSALPLAALAGGSSVPRKDSGDAISFEMPWPPGVLSRVWNKVAYAVCKSRGHVEGCRVK